MVFLFLRETQVREPQVILSPLKIEAYRIDRHPLPDADIYLNQRFIGRTDSKGFFLKDINLVVGESYILRIEKERDGYVYGPWETHFRVEEERRRRREKKKIEEESVPNLEGESDILTEIERAQLGKASQYEKYHFLAVIDGYMFYSIRVLGKDDSTIQDAAVIINGKEEGKTDRKGIIIVRYSGEDSKEDDIQVFKEGEHIWMNRVQINPSASIDIRLNQMLLIDLQINTEYYDVVRGVENVDVYLGKEFVGRTDEEGLFSFKYMNENGVDGSLELTIEYPDPYLPKKQRRNFLIREDLPKLTVVDFAYNRKTVSPKVAVMPIAFKDRNNFFLRRHTHDLKTAIEDNISSEGFFSVVPSAGVSEMFRQFNIDFRDSGMNWKDIPNIKKEVDAILVGDMSGESSGLNVSIQAFDYTGERIFEVARTVTLRELQALSEDVAQRLKANFPLEGNIISVEKKLSINLGARQGIRKNNLFYGFVDYYDRMKKSYAKKRVVKLIVTDVGKNRSEGELESVTEGYLLEAGVKVKRFIESAGTQKDLTVTVEVISEKSPVSEANVYLDDQWYGQTDYAGKLDVIAKSGINIDFLVYKEGYIPGLMSAKVNEDSSVLRFELKRGKSTFQISTEPEGALVFIDGEYRGTSPIIDKPLIVPYGFHLLELEMKGYGKYRNYVNFSDKRVSFTRENRIILYKDLLGDAEKEYSVENIDTAISLLLNIPDSHPDYRSAMELLGYIYFSDIRDYRRAIEYYSRSLKAVDGEIKSAENIFSYYNLGQAYYNEAESAFYSSSEYAQYNYLQAVNNFEYVKARKGRLPVQRRLTVYQDTLFYLAVCYQKLYYLTQKSEYLSKAYYVWIDYFDFFPDELSRDSYFKKQHRIATSYRQEAVRLYGAD